MTCPNCGHRVREGAKFCDECGIVLPDSTGAPIAPEAPAPAAPPRRIGPPNRQQGSFSVNAIAPEGGAPPPAVDMDRARRIFAVVAIVLVAVLCFCCAIAAATLYLLTQNQGSLPFPG